MAMPLTKRCDAAIRIEVRATRLRQLRLARGLTQRELARRVGVTQNYIPALEAGIRQVGPHLRGALLDALGTTFFETFDVVMIDGSHDLLLRPEA